MDWLGRQLGWVAGLLPCLSAPAPAQEIRPAQLQEAMAYYSHNGVAEPGLYDYFLAGRIYLSAGPDCIPSGQYVTGEGETIDLTASAYREGTLFYGFTDETLLASWADATGSSRCTVAMAGTAVAAIMVRPAYLIMNIDTEVVLLTPADFDAMRAIANGPD